MFRIRFRGLMTHALINGRQTVVTIRDPQHRALLTVKKSDLTGESQLANTIITPIGDAPTVSCFSLADLMRVERVNRGVVQVNLNAVPKLSQICDGRTVHPDVLNRRSGPDFHGFLEIDGGTLSIEDWYESAVSFNGSALRCLPRTIIYTVDAIASSVHFYIGTRYIALRPDAEVIYSNVDFDDTSAPNEYQTYKKFFIDATVIHPPVEASAFPCVYGTPDVARAQCSGPVNLGVACSNNQWP